MGNLKFIARKGEAGIVGNIYYGLFEFEESVFLIHLLTSNDFFLDVGANVGHYSLLIAGLNKTPSLAIEPVPETYTKLTENIHINSLERLIDVKNIGVSNRNDIMYFSTNRGTMDRIVNETYNDKVSVEVYTIDSIIGDKVPLAMKMDIEGYEKYALEGAHKLLKDFNLKVLILELNNSGKVYNIKDEDVYNMVLSYGFKPYLYEPSKRFLTELTKHNQHQFNTIFIRDLEFVEMRIRSSKPLKINNLYF